MQKHFLILGLPRSRTAWLSCLFSFDDVHCHHDLTGWVSSIDEMVWTVEATPTRVSGLADSGLGLVLEEFVAKMADPDLKILYVWRNRCDAADSLSEVSGLPIGACMATLERYERILRDCAERFKGEHVNCEELNDARTMKNCCHYLTGCLLPNHHFNKMRRLNVQILPSLMRDAAKGNAVTCIPHEKLSLQTA